MGLRDQKFEETILQKLENLERTIDAVEPTPVRHKLSELIIAMHETVGVSIRRRMKILTPSV